MPKPKKTSATQPEMLKGWQQISEFLGEPVSVVQRWANEDMPVRKQGRFVTTTAGELDAWLGKESGKPVHVATETTDLTAELKRGLSYVRNQGGVEAAASPALGRGDAKIAPSPRKPGKHTGKRR